MVGTAADVMTLLETLRQGGAPLLAAELVAEMGRDQTGGYAIPDAPVWVSVWASPCCAIRLRQTPRNRWEPGAGAAFTGIRGLSTGNRGLAWWRSPIPCMKGCPAAS